MSDDAHVSIGQVKRYISDLVNRVAYAHERIVLTSRGKPKAVLVSIEDYARLEAMAGEGSDAWQAWLAEHDKLNADILARRKQAPVPVDDIWDAARTDLEECDAATGGR
jgi:prevent-host-death family protein